MMVVTASLPRMVQPTCVRNTTNNDDPGSGADDDNNITIAMTSVLCAG